MILVLLVLAQIGITGGTRIEPAARFLDVNPEPIGATTSAAFVQPGAPGILQVGSVTLSVPPDFAGFLDVSVQCGIEICFPPVPDWAGFAGTDTMTLGSWEGIYGADGYMLATDAQNPPPYSIVTISDASLFQWSASTPDPRGLARPGADRVAGTWYNANSASFTVDMQFNDSAAHQLALYFVDWEDAGRTESITISDAAGVTLDTEQLEGFSGGQWLIWNASGHVSISIASTNPTTNAVLSGIFFGPATAAPPPVPADALLPDPAVVMVNARQDSRITTIAAGTNGVGVSLDQTAQPGAVTFQLVNGLFVQQ